jgi:hypothetical protein
MQSGALLGCDTQGYHSLISSTWIEMITQKPAIAVRFEKVNLTPVRNRCAVIAVSERGVRKLDPAV